MSKLNLKAYMDVTPELEEAVRVRQRRRWEKQHPGWK